MCFVGLLATIGLFEHKANTNESSDLVFQQKSHLDDTSKLWWREKLELRECSIPSSYSHTGSTRDCSRMLSRLKASPFSRRQEVPVKQKKTNCWAVIVDFCLSYWAFTYRYHRCFDDAGRLAVVTRQLWAHLLTANISQLCGEKIQRGRSNK